MGESQECMEAMGNFAVSEQRRIERENEIARAVRKALQGYGIPQVQPTRRPQYDFPDNYAMNALEERLLHLSAEVERLTEENEHLREENERLKEQTDNSDVFSILRPYFVNKCADRTTTPPHNQKRYETFFDRI